MKKILILFLSVFVLEVCSQEATTPFDLETTTTYEDDLTTEATTKVTTITSDLAEEVTEAVTGFDDPISGNVFLSATSSSYESVKIDADIKDDQSLEDPQPILLSRSQLNSKPARTQGSAQPLLIGQVGEETREDSSSSAQDPNLEKSVSFLRPQEGNFRGSQNGLLRANSIGGSGSFPGSQVGGSGQFDGVVGGSGSFPGSVVGGSDQFGGSSIGGTGSFPGSQVGGSGQFDGVVGGSGSFPGSVVGGSGQFDGVVGGSGSFPGSVVGGSGQFGGSSIGGSGSFPGGSNFGSNSGGQRFFSRTVVPNFQRNYKPEPFGKEDEAFNGQEQTNNPEPIIVQDTIQVPSPASTLRQPEQPFAVPTSNHRNPNQPFQGLPFYNTRPLQQPELQIESLSAYENRPFRRNVYYWLPSNVHEGQQYPVRTFYYY